MRTRQCLAALSMLVSACLALPVSAADRMRPGQWVGTTISGGRTFPSSSCISRSDADAMNGDAKAVGVYLAKTIPAEICKISDIKVSDGQIIYAATCGTLAPRVVTTSYHGDSSDGTDTMGTKTEARLVGPCK